MTTVEPRVFDVREAATYLRLGGSTVRRLLEEGGLVGFRITDRPRSPWRVPKASCDDWLEARCEAQAETGDPTPYSLGGAPWDQSVEAVRERLERIQRKAARR